MTQSQIVYQNVGGDGFNFALAAQGVGEVTIQAPTSVPYVDLSSLTTMHNSITTINKNSLAITVGDVYVGEFAGGSYTNISGATGATGGATGPTGGTGPTGP